MTRAPRCAVGLTAWRRCAAPPRLWSLGPYHGTAEGTWWQCAGRWRRRRRWLRGACPRKSCDERRWTTRRGAFHAVASLASLRVGRRRAHAQLRGRGVVEALAPPEGISEHVIVCGHRGLASLRQFISSLRCHRYARLATALLVARTSLTEEQLGSDAPIVILDADAPWPYWRSVGSYPGVYFVQVRGSCAHCSAPVQLTGLRR